MATEIKEGADLSPSEAQEKREWDELIDWCFKHEDIKIVDCFLNSNRLANLFMELGMPERMIASQSKITARLEEKVRLLRG